MKQGGELFRLGLANRALAADHFGRYPAGTEDNEKVPLTETMLRHKLCNRLAGVDPSKT